METLKVSSKSDPNRVAGALSNVLRDNDKVEIQAIGAGALNQAVKAIAVARGFVAPSGKNLVCIPAFSDITIDGEEIELSFKEFELLEYFITNEGRALTRDNILNRVWNYDYFGDARTIDTHVKKLRAKMGIKGAYIKTIRAVGYKFEVN